MCRTVGDTISTMEGYHPVMRRMFSIVEHVHYRGGASGTVEGYHKNIENVQ